MENVLTEQLAQLTSDETTLATVIPTVIEAYQAKAEALAAVEAKIASGELVDPAAISAELAPIKTGLDADLAAIQAISPSPAPTPGPTPPTEPTKSVYTFTPGEGIAADERFSASGFETAPTDGSSVVSLEYFSGDIAAGEVNGASVPGYAQYTGAVQVAPAA